MDQTGKIRYNSGSPAPVVNKSVAAGNASNQFGLNGAQYGINGSVGAPPGIGQGGMDSQRFNMMQNTNSGSNSMSSGGMGVGGIVQPGSLSGLGVGGVSSMGGIGIMQQQGQGRSNNQNQNLRQSLNQNSMSNGSANSMGGLGMSHGGGNMMQQMSRGVSLPGNIGSQDHSSNLAGVIGVGNDVGAIDAMGSGKTPFDMSDFPALANRGAGENQGGGQGVAASPYAMHVSQRHQQHSDFNVQNEDFPALPGFSSSSGSGGGNVSGMRNSLGPSPTSSLSSSNKNVSRPPVGFRDMSVGLGGGLGGGANSNPSMLNDSKNPSPAFQLQQRMEQQQHSKGGNPASNSSSEKSESGGQHQYGLLGLLGVIRMEDADRGTLALGTDLTTLGLNLNSSDSLHTTFASPWADGPSTRDPPFQIPACYLQPSSKGKSAGGSNSPSGAGTGLAVKTSHFAKFQLESLFYIFYSIPRDVMQVLAAQELYNREWRYHMDLKLWFAEAQHGAGDAQGNNPAGNQTQYIYFDINAWERRLFSGNIPGGIESSFMRKEAVFSLSNSNSPSPGGTAATGQNQQQQQQRPVVSQQGQVNIKH